MTIVITNVMEVIMIKVSKSVLKAKMLEYFRKVEQTGEYQRRFSQILENGTINLKKMVSQTDERP